MQELINRYTTLFWESPIGSGTEAAAWNLLAVLEEEQPYVVVTQLLADAHEALVSAQVHGDSGAIQYFQEQIALFEQCQAELVALSL